MKVTPEELAHALYANTVYKDSWPAEQQSLKFRWFGEAERLIANMAKAGFEIVKLDKPVDKPAPVAPVAKDKVQVPGDTPPVDEFPWREGDDERVKKHK